MIRDRSIARLLLAATTILLGLEGASARADRIILRSGNEIRGEVTPDPDRPDRVMVLTENASKPIPFPREMVSQIVTEPTILDDYLIRRDRVEPSAEAHHQLGLWCDEHKLASLARLHYRRAAELDKSYAPAHRKLGHTLMDGRWLSPDEVRETQGLVRYKGKWISQEEKDEVDARAAATAEKVAWMRRIKIYRQDFLNGSDAVRGQAVLEMMAIRDPSAVAPLVQMLGGGPEALRDRLVLTLGAIPGAEASAALVSLLLSDPDPSIRQAAINALAIRKDPDALHQLTRALRSSDSDVVGRAAWALAHLDAVSAVPKLISALVGVRTQVVWEPTSNVGGGGFGMSFGSVSPVSSGYGFPVLTPPVTAPGAFAFGATSVPYYPTSNFGVSMGSGPSPPRAREVRVPQPNPEVLEALEKLTGNNFGFDMTTWRRWLSTSFESEPVPARRVPQP